MLGARLGAYSVLEELGAGGMGTVYRGEDSAGAAVAIKVIHSHLLSSPGFFKRFLREADLGRKVQHENVVRTLDVDATLVGDKQVNYMVMEYVEGRPLRNLLNELRIVPETLLREIALQTAAGLAAIHAADIVHRDLKPENILITNDQTVRIMDLGVAKLQEASIAITKEGQFAGSLLYAAPEQFRGGDVGPASDLYSLGVLLYELATGQNPFRDDDAAAVIAAHLQRDPPPACERNPDVSLFLSEVIATLLAKAQADRFSSARVLHDLLDRGEQSEWWIERAQRIHAQRSHLPRIQVPRETTLLAREGDLALLRGAWDETKRGRGSTLLFEGEAGIGKTRLLDAFVRTLEGEDCHVLYGSYPPSGGIGGMSDAILDKFGEAGLAQSLRRYLTITPTLAAGFAALLKHEAAPTGAESLGSEAMSTVMCHLLRGMADEKPTLWIIDDIHFAPGESRHQMLSMARALEAHRALLVLTARSGLPEGDLAHFTRLPHFRRVALGRLGGRDIIELLKDAFRSEALAEKLGGKIAYKSDGVPFFVFEMIRSLKEGRLIRQQADGTYVQSQLITDIEVPSAVKDLIEARLQGLTREQRAILDVGAVQGISFQPSLVAAVLEEKKVRVLQEVAEVERRFGLVRGEATSCRFDQNQVQEVLYQGLLPELRSEYHALLADAQGEKGDPFFLAFHHLRGSRPEEARPHLRPAIDQLTASYRNEALLDLCERALAATGVLEGVQRCGILLQKVRLHTSLGQHVMAAAGLSEAAPLVDAAGEDRLRVELLTARGNHEWFQGQLAGSQRTLEEAMEVARAAGDPEMTERLAVALHGVYSQLGLHERSCTSTHPTIVGLSAQYRGHYAEALAAFEGAVTRFRGRKDRQNEGVALVNLGRLQAACGDPETGRATLEQSKEILRAVGQRRPESYALHRLGTVAEQRGDCDEARRLYGQALALRREIQYAFGVGETLLALGHLENSPELLKEALALARQTGRPDEIVLGSVYLDEEAEEALRTYGDRMRVLDRTQAHFALWQRTKAPKHLEEAGRLHLHLLEHAPEECRAAMARNVPLHREIKGATC